MKRRMLVLTKDGGTPSFAISFKETEQFIADDHVQIHSDLIGRALVIIGAQGSRNVLYFVKQKDIPFDHQTETELDSTSFAVRYLMHVPVEVDVEDIKKAIPALLVPIASDGV